MAQVVLTQIGAWAGATLDRMALGALEPPRRRGGRLSELRLSSTAEGTPMPLVLGTMRVPGQLIWAARFKEHTERSGGGKTPRVEESRYSLSFAMGLGEGPIDGLGRVWADGKAMELSGVNLRLYRGDEGQAPDPLIEAVEGAAPAYRGTAYVVFEDLPLGPYGNRLPQLSFEVFRRPRGESEGLEDLLTGVNLIPGCGEFAYATEPVMRREGLTRSRPENVHNAEGRADLLASLDQLTAAAPNLERVTLVVAWFGDDLRVGHCRIRPGVDAAAKDTVPLTWRVAGLERGEAHQISQTEARANYGGTPSDQTVAQAVQALKARGLKVVIHPFLLMDVPEGNGLPDPYGGEEQGAFPWRGRITCDPAPGRPGSPDGTAAVVEEVEGFFGGPEEEGLRRFVLHYAALAVEAGADGLLLGSELRGVTTLRAASGVYPAVDQLCALAAECRTVLGPERSLSYAADWSEYFGHQPPDGSGDAAFHLDPLWAHGGVDHVAIDWYPPLTDWRDGPEHLDALEGWGGADDPTYLAARIRGGEGFDWFYADEAAREAQDRTPITDGAYAEPWVFRPKALLEWWSNEHYDRPGGVRTDTPTDWVPGSKPIRLAEFGCAAVDKGPNAPNLFLDPKSAESALPPFSSGGRDDAVQRAALTALLGFYGAAENNPVSPLTGRPMIEAMDAWCWDARPFPAFPAETEAWGDGGAWRTGHWLNGRLVGEAEALFGEVIARAGVAFEGGGPLPRRVEGLIAWGGEAPAGVLEDLRAACGADLIETPGGGLRLKARTDKVELELTGDALARNARGLTLRRERVLATAPGSALVRFLDPDREHQVAGVTEVAGTGGAGAIRRDLGLACRVETARAAAHDLLETARGGEAATVWAAPETMLRLEPGDVLAVDGLDGAWRVAALAQDEAPHLTLAPALAARRAVAGDPSGGTATAVQGPPLLEVLDLPPLPGRAADDRPMAVVAAEPWRPFAVHAGVGPGELTRRGEVLTPARVGRLTRPLAGAGTALWDRASVLEVELEGAAPAGVGEAAALSGRGLIAVQALNGGWELLHFAEAALLEGGAWRLSVLLRGVSGTEEAAAEGAQAGALVVWLDEGLPRLEVSAHERGHAMLWRASPYGAAAGVFSTDVERTWSGVAGRPFAPCHLRARPHDGGLEATWVRRGRTGGDAWDLEPPLGEAFERYRVRVLAGDAVLREDDTTEPRWAYAGADQDADLAAAGGAPLVIEVSQYSDVRGWGRAARLTL
ncbi:glycoside hydrolase/phage tail family protein [Brevundimonas sp. 2R-24]|uniref:Glycoside hydrolase/phage tail family protein n=1 Tax=Peiella sedimenti TaxID=3061083 RepID=A0ABT8SJ93_9CAUL|nr:glycoside hydrolase/phage tail family protein [Caulobacteraceae bacterium XZ-24]